MVNKEKFLEALRKKLDVLEESEIEDIITEYDGYIEEKIKKGSTEDEAVKSMGDVNELAKELLSAYKVKGTKNDTFTNLVDRVISIFERIVSVFTHKSFVEIIRFIIELVVIFLIIGFCKIPFMIIADMGLGMFNLFGFGIGNVFSNIWHFILEFAYLIFAVLLFIKIFEGRYLNEDYEPVLKSTSKEKTSNNEKKETNKTVKAKEIKDKSSSNSFIDLLSTLCMWFIKFILLLILFGVCCYLFGMTFCIGICIYLLCVGITYFGAYIIVLALFILGIIFFLFLFNFIFNRKSRIGILLIVSLVSIVLLGVGTGISLLEFTNTTILYNKTLENNKTLEYSFDVVDNLIISPYFSENDYVIDDSMGKKIKVVYEYNDQYGTIEGNPSINLENNYKVLRARYYHNDINYKRYLDEFINNLKDKKICVDDYDSVTIKFYMSNDTLKKIRNNKEKQGLELEKKYNDNKSEDICEYLEEQDIYLPEYCHHDERHFN